VKAEQKVTVSANAAPTSGIRNVIVPPPYDGSESLGREAPEPRRTWSAARRTGPDREGWGGKA
jgi:hypothetical protein